MRLYLASRVTAVEATPAWREQRELSERRKEAAAKAVNTKIDRLYDDAEAWEPRIIVLSREEVTRRAIESYNEWQMERGHDSRAHRDSEPLFLERLTVNYIRHELSTYDHAFYGRTGIRDVHGWVRNRVLRRIAEAYPWLEAECVRQIASRHPWSESGPSDAAECMAPA